MHGRAVFAGTKSNGIFLSTDFGSNWTAVNLGLPNKNILSLCISDSTIYAGTYYGGLWLRPISEMVGIVDRPHLSPTSLNLRIKAQSNHQMIISAALPKQEKVSVDIFDLFGNRIAKVISKVLGAGTNSLTWNTRNISSGRYIVRMQTKTETISKVFLVLQ